jgi:hypothetical protein
MSRLAGGRGPRGEGWGRVTRVGAEIGFVLHICPASHAPGAPSHPASAGQLGLFYAIGPLCARSDAGRRFRGMGILPMMVDHGHLARATICPYGHTTNRFQHALDLGRGGNWVRFSRPVGCQNSHNLCPAVNLGAMRPAPNWVCFAQSAGRGPGLQGRGVGEGWPARGGNWLRFAHLLHIPRPCGPVPPAPPGKLGSFRTIGLRLGPATFWRPIGFV